MFTNENGKRINTFSVIQDKDIVEFTHPLPNDGSDDLYVPAAVQRHPDEWDVREVTKETMASEIESRSMKQLRKGAGIGVCVASLGSALGMGFSCAAGVCHKNGDRKGTVRNGAISALAMGVFAIAFYGTSAALDQHHSSMREAISYRERDTKRYKVWSRVKRGH